MVEDKGYVIVYKRTQKRVYHNGQVTPFCEYPHTAMRYITDKLNNSPYVTIKPIAIQRVKEKAKPEKPIMVSKRVIEVIR